MTLVRSGFVKMKTILTVCIDSDWLRSSIRWMSAGHYQTRWRSMWAFARTSFYDGRIRIDLAGHERKGTVPVSRYTTYASEIETLLRECIFATGAGRSITSNAPGAVTH